MEYTLDSNGLQLEDWQQLRLGVGWDERPAKQLQQALEKGLYNVAVRQNGKIVGMGRLVGDGALYWYLQDIIVLPMHQGNGLGARIVQHLLEWVQKNTPAGNFVMVGLFAAEGKEGFYKKMGFSQRPDEQGGAGMMLYMGAQ